MPYFSKPATRLKIFLLCTFAFAQAAAAFAMTGRARAETYVVGIENIEYMPHYSAVGEEVYGYIRDLLDAFAKDEGINFRYQAYPIIRLSRNLATGIVDFKYPANPGWIEHSGATLIYSDPVAEFTDGLSIKPENRGKPIKSIALVRGFTPQAFQKQIENGEIHVSEHDSLRDVVQHVLRGRSDAVYANKSVVKYFMANFLHKPDALIFDDQENVTRDSYRLGTIQHRKIIEKLNQWLAKNSGRIGKLKKSYGLE